MKLINTGKRKIGNLEPLVIADVKKDEALRLLKLYPNEIREAGSYSAPSEITDMVKDIEAKDERIAELVLENAILVEEKAGLELALEDAK
tara:strand:- start:2752 stop:3021 length:270 start_codon:yes stop_codon:yes gene_type:complete